MGRGSAHRAGERVPLAGEHRVPDQADTERGRRTRRQPTARGTNELALALEQAGATLAETGMSVDEYLRQLREHLLELLEQGKAGRRSIRCP